MQKAYYTSECLGHYGLAFKEYCHFTSPIRRYSDLWIHRIIKRNLNNELDINELNNKELEAEKVSKIVSLAERKAIIMEREIEKIKKAQYMEQWIGYEATGIISGVVKFGFFVELENTIEGLVKIESLTDDYYRLNEKNYCFVGDRNHYKYSLGDTVDVICTAVDPNLGTIDFQLA